jgi:hypothetical protein
LGWPAPPGGGTRGLRATGWLERGMEEFSSDFSSCSGISPQQRRINMMQRRIDECTQLIDEHRRERHALQAAVAHAQEVAGKAMGLLGTMVGILVAFVEQHTSPERATHAGQTVRVLTEQVLAACRAVDWHVAPGHAASLRHCGLDPY